MQLEIPITTAVAAAGIARETGAVVMVNASPAGAKPHDLLALAQLADVVVVNEAEAREWHWPVPHLVITRGSRGASYLGADERFDVPAPTVRPVDTTGAGDVFAGVLAAGWLDGYEEALRRACAAGPCRRWCRARATAHRTPRPSRMLWPIAELKKGDMTSTASPRPPDGDWLGTRFLTSAARARSPCARSTGPRRATR